MQFKSGTYVGDGAAQNISLGFVPDCVLIVNLEDGDLIGIWHSSLADGTSVDIAAAVAANANNGISDYVGSDTAAKGFTVGTDFSEADKTFLYMAFRNTP